VLDLDGHPLSSPTAPSTLTLARTSISISQIAVYPSSNHVHTPLIAAAASSSESLAQSLNRRTAARSPYASPRSLPPMISIRSSPNVNTRTAPLASPLAPLKFHVNSSFAHVASIALSFPQQSVRSCVKSLRLTPPVPSLNRHYRHQLHQHHQPRHHSHNRRLHHQFHRRNVLCPYPSRNSIVIALVRPVARMTHFGVTWIQPRRHPPHQCIGLAHPYHRPLYHPRHPMDALDRFLRKTLTVYLRIRLITGRIRYMWSLSFLPSLSSRPSVRHPSRLQYQIITPDVGKSKTHRYLTHFIVNKFVSAFP